MIKSTIGRSKIFIIGLLLFVCISCNNNTKIGENQVDKRTVEQQTETLIEKEDSVEENHQSAMVGHEKTSKLYPKKTDYKNFKVVYLDFYNDRLQRVFVTMDKLNIYDTTMIHSIICEIKTLFDIDKKSNVSFFSEKKYADYKTELFIDEGHPLPLEEYENWMNYYYLAEYEFQNNEYITYPSCRKDCKRKQIFDIECE